MTLTSDDSAAEFLYDHDDSVVDYLTKNPEFFTRNPHLLSVLDLPHETGNATSLVERQVAILRERNIDLRRQLRELIDNATTNDRVFSKTRSFTLALMDVPSIGQLDQVLADELISGFQADHAVCYVLGWREPSTSMHFVGIGESADPPVPRLFSQPEPTCGTYRPEEYAQLFGDQSLTAPGSVALVPMRREHLKATLAIGSADPNRFHREMGTLFLEYIGEVLVRTLVGLIARTSK